MMLDLELRRRNAIDMTNVPKRASVVAGGVRLSLLAGRVHR